MPIIKGKQFGKNKNVTHLKFGTGDISVSHGRDADDENIKVVVFGQDTPKPVEEYNNIIPVEGGNSDGLEDIVVMSFTRPESIDVVIDRLQQAKEELLKVKI